MELSGWGRYPKIDCHVARPRAERDVLAAAAAVAGAGHTPDPSEVPAAPVIARGAGRAYGDSALNRDGTIDMTGFDRMIAFDADTGSLTVEAGVVLGDIIETFLPKGWFPPVTPGTKFVTVGGMIAADVHGKNHHKAGSFRGFVDWIDLADPSGQVRRCSEDENADLFDWTVGGMGLTGIILRVSFRLIRVESAWIRRKTIPAAGLDETMAAFDAADDWTYSVAWIDCLAAGAQMGRSLLMVGEHARRDELTAARLKHPFAVKRRRQWRVPPGFPGAVLNNATIRAFNAAYYRLGVRQAAESLTDWDRFFYPLDAVLDWNRIYGRRGFVQFQCVLPLSESPAGLAAILEATGAAGRGSFLAVLKRFGPGRAGEKGLSFPMEGYTLALDFPATPPSLALVDRLHAIAMDHGGSFYLAKDARLRAPEFARSDPRVADLTAFRAQSGATARFGSAQSRRLEL